MRFAKCAIAVVAEAIGCAGNTSAIEGEKAVILHADQSCPAAVPTNGASCKPVASCTYVSGPNGACTVRADWSSPPDPDQNVTWIATVPDAGVRGSAGSVASIVP